MSEQPSPSPQVLSSHAPVLLSYWDTLRYALVHNENERKKASALNAIRTIIAQFQSAQAAVSLRRMSGTAIDKLAATARAGLSALKAKMTELTIVIKTESVGERPSPPAA